MVGISTRDAQNNFSSSFFPRISSRWWYGGEYKELNGTKRIPPTLCTVSFEIYITYKWYVCMLDCSEQDGASGDTEEKMWRRAGAFSQGDGLGIVARAWRDSDGISRNATCFF